MFRLLIVFSLAAFAFVIIMIPIMEVFTSFWDMVTGIVATLLMIPALMGIYIERIRAFVRGNRE